MRRDLLLLTEIVSAGDRAVTIAQRYTVELLTANPDARDALLWNMTVLGEAASQISQALRDRTPDLRWNAPVALRNRIVHGYWSIDLDVVHAAALDDVPTFIAAVRELQQSMG
jgi:uncharacterized protein with HEPN domain